MRYRKFLVFSMLLASNQILYSHDRTDPDYPRGDYRLMFYNVENLFDTRDDSLKLDDEFLPSGEKKWYHDRYRKKIHSVYKVIVAIGEESPPEIIGLCEIENERVLKDLIFSTPLSKYPYGIVHKESGDRRGIDVALLYRMDKITYISENFLCLNLAGDKTSRDILHFKAQLTNIDTIHFFVNHWPSRRGGELRSEPYRISAARVLRNYIDSLQASEDCPEIIIMGDFNDTPLNTSLHDSLMALKSDHDCNHLINLSARLMSDRNFGTYRYRSEWIIFDQIIVSRPVFYQEGIYTDHHIRIFGPDFLVTDEPTYGGIKPYRTYIGPRYLGGYSDHLPVYLDLMKVKDE